MIETILVALWAAYGLFGPVILRGSYARHNAYVVWMPKAVKNGNHLPAVRVQEVGEWKLSKLVAVLVGTGALFLPISEPNMQIGVPFLSMLMADVISRKYTDYPGHGAEIIEAERLGLTGYRAAEIDRMIRLDHTRKGMTPAQVDAKLRQWHWLARIVWRLGK